MMSEILAPKPILPPKAAFILNSPVIGGAERYLARVVEGFPQSIRVVSPKGRISEILSKTAPETVLMDMGDCLDTWRGLNLYLPTNRMLLGRLTSLMIELKQKGVQVVHLQMFKDQILASQAAYSVGLPVIWTQHCHCPSWLTKTPVRKAFVGAANRYATRIIAVSEAVKHHMIDLGVREEKLEVIYNGVDIRRFRPERADDLRTSLGIKPDQRLIGCSGRLHRLKGQKVLIQVLPEILKEHPQTRCLLVGGGSREAEYRTLARQLGVDDKIIFVGFTDGVADYLKTMDIYISPSYMEGFPLNTLEAMACGKPVVSSAVGGIPEQIIHGQNGILVPPGDHACLIQAITTLLDNPQMAARLGTEARATCEEKFNEEEMLSKTAAFFMKVVEEAR